MIVKEQVQNFAGDQRMPEELHSRSPGQIDPASRPGRPRVALLTPYTGENLGDAAIQDAAIANLRLRLPAAQFSGITLNRENFLERHGSGAFALCGAGRPFYAMCRGRVAGRPGDATGSKPSMSVQRDSIREMLRKAFSRVPALWWCLTRVRRLQWYVWAELRHFARGYRFLRTQDLLVVSGGGQLDEECGGPWGHPFALFKWAVLARMARVPFAVASVGACRVNSISCRFFLSAALRMARYRSYRDKNSKKVAIGLWRRAAADPVVPDLAFSLPTSELPPAAGICSGARGRRIVAVSPIAYAKPGTWVHENAALYDRYLQEMARAVDQLLQRDYFLLMVWSDLGDDRVVPEILGRLGHRSSKSVARQLHVPTIKSWRDLVAHLQGADFLIASRLHSTILGFVTQTPTVAISFNLKVDWVMEDLGQTDFLLHIEDFTAMDVVEALARLEAPSRFVSAETRSYQLGIQSAFAGQYDTLAELAIASTEHRN